MIRMSRDSIIHQSGSEQVSKYCLSLIMFVRCVEMKQR
nr:MAG TPA: hypothetical protein [Caudoviricetes sp.]